MPRKNTDYKLSLPSSPILGVHTGISGGLYRSIREALVKGCRTWQIFSRNPRGWSARPLTAGEIRQFRIEHEKSGLTPLIIHSSYLINLAVTEGEIRSKSIAAFRSRVDRHWHIGKGEIGSAGLAHIINHPKLRQLPYILETSQVEDDDDIINLAAAKSLILTAARGKENDR